MYYDYFDFSPPFDQQQTPAAQDQFTFSQYPDFLDHGSFIYPTLLPSPALNAYTLAERHPYPAQSDQARFPTSSTYHTPYDWPAEAGRELHISSDPAMGSSFNFHDSASFSLPSSEWSAVADDLTPSTAEFSPSSVSDIVNSDRPQPLLPSTPANTLPQSSQLNDVPVRTSFEETVSETLPGPVDASQPHRMRLPPVATSRKCSKCTQVFASRAQLKRHEPTHGRFLCDIHGCGKSFKLSKDLRRHQATVLHADSALTLRNPLKCHICGKKTRREDALKRHLATHQKRID